MTESQKLQIKMSEIRQQANSTTNTEADRTRLLGELAGLEEAFRTALAAETAQVDQDFAGGAAESSELRASDWQGLQRARVWAGFRSLGRWPEPSRRGPFGTPGSAGATRPLAAP